MSSKLSQVYRLKVLDYTSNDTIAPHGILDLFQDIAGKHSMQYNMSYEEMLSKNLIWVILRVKYKVIKEIPLYSTVNVITWPKKKGLVDFDRYTQILDIDGNVLVNGVTKWVVVDYNNRKIVPAKHIEYNAEVLDEELFDEPFVALKKFNINDNVLSYKQKVEFCDVDHNGHTNNAKYSCMVLNAIKMSKNEAIDAFQIDFIKETYLGDVITLYYYKEDNIYNVMAKCNDDVIFLCNIKTKKA